MFKQGESMKANRTVPQWRVQPRLKKGARGFALYLQFPLPRPIGNKLMGKANGPSNRVNLNVSFARQFHECFHLVVGKVVNLCAGG
jgi:hypothetical protein